MARVRNPNPDPNLTPTLTPTLTLTRLAPSSENPDPNPNPNLEQGDKLELFGVSSLEGKVASLEDAQWYSRLQVAIIT